MNKITISEAIASFTVKPKGSMSILLGAGASVSSGIMSAKKMVWDFKRKIFCLEQKIPESKIGDLSEKTKQDEIQFYFNDLGKQPKRDVADENRYYFKALFPNKRDRELYIQKQVKNKMPSHGYLCLGALVIEGKIKIINTTNFDDLVKAGVYAINSGFSLRMISSAIKKSIVYNLDDEIPCIIKLHGDYLLDCLQNTEEELQKLSPSIGLKFKEGLHNKGLIIVGYGGNDITVMTTLEKIINKGDLPYGVLWCKWKGEELSSRSKDFMKMACKKNDRSGIVDIDNFDDFMYRLYLTLNKPHKIIDEWHTKEKFYSCI